MPTFDNETLICTLDSGETNIDWIDVYSDWKTWSLATPENRKCPPMFRTTGGDPLNTLLNAGSYWFLRNDYGWRIKPPEEHITILASGNLAPEDATVDMFLPTTGAYTTQILGLQPITQGFSTTLAGGVEYGLFSGGVTCDTLNGFSGTGIASNGYLIGTSSAPVDNFDDSLAIAASRGFTTLYVIGNAIIDNSNDYEGFIFVGESQTKSELNVHTDALVDGCEFYDATIIGTLDGDAKLKNCTIGTLNYVNGIIEQCLLEVGTITLGGGAEAHFLDCWSGVAGSNTPIIDMGGSGQELSLRNYNGGIKITNKTGTDPVSIDLNSGHVILDSTVTNGEIVIRGIGKLTDNSNGATVNVQDFVNPGTIASAVMGEDVESGVTVEEALKVIVSALAGKVSGAGTTNIKFRDIGDTKDVIDATVDENGNRTSVTLDTA